MATKLALPSTYVQEEIKYNDLYLRGVNRTSTGNPSWASSSSSTVYTVSDNGGENSLMALIFAAISNYLISATDFNGKVEQSDFDTHVGTKASASVLAHIKTDNITIQADGNGVISTIQPVWQSWVPNCSGYTAGGARYCVIGKLCIFYIQSTTSITGDITNLPIKSANYANCQCVVDNESAVVVKNSNTVSVGSGLLSYPKLITGIYETI